MFSEELIKIIEKYFDKNSQQVNNINSDIQDIIKQLSDFRDILGDRLKELLCNNENADELYNDIKLLNTEISMVKPLPVTILNFTEQEIAEEITPSLQEKQIQKIIDFEKYTHIHICCEDVCPKCIEKLIPTNLYYQRKIDYTIHEEYVSGFRCPNCRSLYMIDSDIEKLDCANTNIEIHTKRYNKLSIQNEVYVVMNVNKCSANDHDLEDILGTIPIIKSDGSIAYTYVDVIHCKTCKKYIMLKNTYQRISDFLACQVIDETKESVDKTNSTFSNYDSTGSKLSQLGYNVNCVDKLTEKQRETLLAAIISSKLLTQGEIIGNIDRNISSGRNRIGSKKDWSNAIAKWEHDKEFVQSFDIERSNNDINIGKIILRYRKDT